MTNSVYHPFLNSNGTYKASDGKFWYETTVTLNSVADCFTPANIGTVIGRPDGKSNQYIYAENFIDTREYAKILNRDEVNLIIADKEENGVEEVVSIVGYANQTYSGGNTSYRELVADTMTHLNDVTQRKAYAYNGTIWKKVVYIQSGGIGYIVTSSATIPIISNLLSWVNGGFDADASYTSIIVIDKKSILSSNTKLSIDLIGNPTNYPQVLKDRLSSGVGVVGINPLLVSDTGESYIILGQYSTVKISNKSTNNLLQNLLFDTSGAWQNRTDLVTINTSENSAIVRHDAISALDILSYTSKNKPYIQTIPKPVIDVEPKVIASNSHSIYKGALIGNQVSGKIQVGNGANGYESKVLENVNIGEYDYIAEVGKLYYLKTGTIFKLSSGFVEKEGTIVKFLGIADSPNWGPVETGWFSPSIDPINWGYTEIGRYTSHSTIALDNSNSPASKWFKAISQGSNGVVGSVYGKEMVWDYSKDSGINDDVPITAGVAFSVTAGDISLLTGFTNSLLNGCIIQWGITVSTIWNSAILDGYTFDSYGNIYNDVGVKLTDWRIWDGNGFGDNDKFDQLTNGTKTDLNGRTVRTFVGHLPINGEVK